MHHFVAEMHMSAAKWYVVGYGIGALWDMTLVHGGISGYECPGYALSFVAMILGMYNM